MSAIVHIQGNLGSDPALETLQSGTEVAKFSVAVSIYKGRDKEKVTNWYRVTVFGKQVQLVSDWRKGHTVAVHGRLEVREYEKDGAMKYSLDLTADGLTNFSKFVNAKGGDSSHAPAAAPAPKPAAPTNSRRTPDDDLPF